MKSFLAICLVMSFSTSASALVVKSKDILNKCTLYRVTTENSPKTTNETVIIDREAYGLSLIDLEVDFNQRLARVDLVANVVLGINKNVVGSKIKIQESHPEFKELTNLLNRRLNLLEKACVDHNNNLIYASLFEVN